MSYLPIIALVGRPNVGKSSLFNLLTQSDAAIVHPTPGVTRDRHYSRITIDEENALLVDTGGIEGMDALPASTAEKMDQLSAPMHEQTMLAIEEADIILCLFDAKEGVTFLDRDIANHLRQSKKTILYLANKIDGPEKEEILLSQFYELGLETIHALSSAHSYNLRFVKEELARLCREQQAARTETSDELPAATIRIACIGRPNVGKSSFINRLSGEQRMVVSHIPGTTRDAVDTLIQRGDNTYLFIDTAGIRRRGKVNEKIEKFSVMKTLNALTRADIALVLLDAGEGITEQDTKVIGYALDQGRAVILLVNKWDLMRQEEKRRRQLTEEIQRAVSFAPYIPVLPVSSLTGFGTEKTFPIIEKIAGQYSARISTGILNRVLRRAVAAHTPPLNRGRRIKFYYVTQGGTAPPTFLIMSNDPEAVHFSYERYLVNCLRKELKLDNVPIRLVFKKST